MPDPTPSLEVCGMTRLSKFGHIGRIRCAPELPIDIDLKTGGSMCSFAVHKLQRAQRRPTAPTSRCRSRRPRTAQPIRTAPLPHDRVSICPTLERGGHSGLAAQRGGAPLKRASRRRHLRPLRIVLFPPGLRANYTSCEQTAHRFAQTNTRRLGL